MLLSFKLNRPPIPFIRQNMARGQNSLTGTQEKDPGYDPLDLYGEKHTSAT